MKHPPKILWILVVILFAVAVLFSLRFILGGDEDTWICVDNQWIKHGNPNASQPQSGCGEEN